MKIFIFSNIELTDKRMEFVAFTELPCEVLQKRNHNFSRLIRTLDTV